MDFIKEWENIIPIKSGDPDPKKNKLPLIVWKPYIIKPFPKAELKKYEPCNHALMCGITNDNLLILDWDFKDGKKSYFKTIYLDFLDKFPKLADTYTVETPHGFHFYYEMVDFLETRHPIKNSLFINSKKLGKEVFTGAIKTKFFKYLAGWDILGQKGYALIPPSKLGEGLEYKLHNDTEVCKITLEQFNRVKEFFLLDKVKKPRKPFIDLMNGVMEIEIYAIETGQKEFIYWKYLFREMWHYCGMEPHEVYRFLKNQIAFDKDKCDVQLQHHPYTDNPLSTESMKKYFPNYYTNTTVIENTEIVLKNLVPDVVFSESDILKRIEDLSSDTTDNKLLVDIFIQIPSSELGFINKVKTLLSNHLDNYGKIDLNKLITRYVADVGNLRSVEVREGEYTIEDFNGFADSDDFDLGNILQIIKYDDEYILNTNKGITLYNRAGEFKQVLFKPLRFNSKVIDINRQNIELFTLELDGYMFKNRTKSEICELLKMDIQHYNKFGLDVLKRIITFYSEIIPEKNPEYITGWDNGWKLPLNESDKGFTIINHSDIQRETYRNIENHGYKKYSDKEKEVIKEKFKRFYDITQIEQSKKATIFGWTISAPFRMFFIEQMKLFPALYLCGDRNTGKSTIGDFCCNKIYHHFNDLVLSPSVLNSDSQLEDRLSSSTFPINIQEISVIKNQKSIDIMKDSTTNNSAMFKKNSNGSTKINKMKVASFMLDGNEPVEQFLDPAWNSKMIFLKFKASEEIEYNPEWNELYNELTKERLFSLIYDYTKDWTNKDIKKRLNTIRTENPELMDDLTYEDQRLGKAYLVIAFGIELFLEVFDMDIKFGDVVELLIQGRTYIAEDLLEDFLGFISECVQLGETLNRGEKPMIQKHYLKHPLRYNKSDELVFTRLHLKDFETATKQNFNSLPKLLSLLQETVKNDSLLSYNSKWDNSQNRVVKGIVVKKEFLNP